MAPARMPEFELLSGSQSEELFREIPSLSDPMLFALVTEHGFSGPVWKQSARFSYALPDWNEPPRWLVPSSGDWGSALGRMLAAERARRRELYLAPAPLDPPAVGPPTDYDWRSTVELSGELVQRRLVSEIQLPSIAHSEILSNSVVRVAVNESGTTLSAVLISSSGSKLADDEAMKFAREAKFEPVTGAAGGGAGKLSFGQMIFEWLTLPLEDKGNQPR